MDATDATSRMAPGEMGWNVERKEGARCGTIVGAAVDGCRDSSIRPNQIRRRSLSLPLQSHSFPLCKSFAIISGRAIFRGNTDVSFSKFMLSAQAVDLTFLDDDEWKTPPLTARLYRAASVGNSWGVTSIGRGFDWDQNEDIEPSLCPKPVSDTGDLHVRKLANSAVLHSKIMRPVTNVNPSSQAKLTTPSYFFTTEPGSMSPTHSRPSSPRSPSTRSSPGPPRPPLSRSPTTPRPRRRSSQQRVSLIAGRVSIAPVESPSPQSILPPSLHRTESTTSFLSSAASTRPPSPDKETFLGGRSISEFVIEAEIGRGAYGLVKRAREIQADGSLGVRHSPI